MTSKTMISNNVKKVRPVGDVSDTTNAQVTVALNGILSNEFALFTKTLNFHWNITGPRFHSLHIFLEEHYKSLLEIMDETAERIRVLGERPLSTIKEMYAETDIKESTEEPIAKEMLGILLKDHLIIQKQIKEAVQKEENFEQDPGSQDFLIGLLQKHEKMSWMLNSHLETETNRTSRH
jgi:starvation-inducible DNA-binding protein